MFGLIKKMFTGLLISIANAANHKKCLSLKNQKYMVQPILIIYTLMKTVKNFTTIHLQLN